MRKSTLYLLLPGVAVVLTAALFSAEFVASAQNSNSSMTMTESKPKPKSHRRTTTRWTGRCDPKQQEQTDLSGTYTGKARHENEAPVDATLTITGNTFTMTSGSDTHTGRVTAVTTCGYTAVTMMMGDLTPPTGTTAPPPLPAMSLRAKKSGNNLTLNSVPGEPKSVWFSTVGSGMKTKPRKHRSSKPKTDATAAPAKTTP